jgi:hypothetical protein
MTVADNEAAIIDLNERIANLENDLQKALAHAKEAVEQSPVTEALAEATQDFIDWQKMSNPTLDILVGLMMSLQANRLNTTDQYRQDLLDKYFGGEDPTEEHVPWIVPMLR